jgi:hypothetical protein
LGAGTVHIEPEPWCTVKHGITCHRITLCAHRGTLQARRLPAPFVLMKCDDTAPWTTLARKVVRASAQRTAPQQA